MTLHYLDDFVVGTKYVTGSVTVNDADIIEFATRFDPQPFHTDAEAARQSFFGGLVASGWHTAALTMRLLVTSDMQPAGGLIGAGGESISWPRPVRGGDTLHVVAEVLSARRSESRPAQGLVVMRVTTLNQRGEEVQVFQPRLIVQRKE